MEICGGCNAKIGANYLDSLISNLSIYNRDDVLIGCGDDGALIEVEGKGIILTVDFFPALVKDPYVFGEIAVANALSDIYAMGGEVICGLNIVTYPEDEDLNVLEEILKGGGAKLVEAGATLAGGHSIYDKKTKYGLCAVGKVDLDKVWTNVGAKVGDVLILTKSLGISLILSGCNSGELEEKYLENAVKSMRTLNKYAAEVLRGYNISACTDVTGFGLLGHLNEMLNGVSAEIYSDEIPVLEGAKKAVEEFIFTAGAQRNRNSFGKVVDFQVDDFAMEEILFDPQTSGGLLVALSKDEGVEVLSKLMEHGIEAKIIGSVIDKEEFAIKVREKK